MTVILTGAEPITVDPMAIGRDGLWLRSADLERITGFVLKPEGLCRGEVCVPVPPDRADEFVDGGAVNLAAFWPHRGGHLVGDASGEVWSLTEPATDIAAAIEGEAAPDFALPDASGRVHRLSDYRGQKVLLASWASWCGCRTDLPVWQELYEELKGDGFTVIAVALDTRPGAAELWIEKAAPSYPALIDRQHRVAELYNMVNVPQAVWIDEEGRIVRSLEVAGSYDAFRYSDPATGERDPVETAKLARAREIYLDAVRDWVARGDESAFVRDAGLRHSLPDDDIAAAHARFRLGTYLTQCGRSDEGRALLDEASRLHPDSWTIWRDAAEKTASGIAGGPAFRERVNALGDRRYYARIDMPGMP